MELAFIGALILAALLSLGIMSDPVADTRPVQHDPYTASGLAWNN
jgi:hypothetical protein